MGCGNNKTENNNFLIMTVSTWNAMIGTAMQKNFAVETVGDNEYEKKNKTQAKTHRRWILHATVSINSFMANFLILYPLKTP